MNIMYRGAAFREGPSHTPDSGSADDKAFSHPRKDKGARIPEITWLPAKGYKIQRDSDAGC